MLWVVEDLGVVCNSLHLVAVDLVELPLSRYKVVVVEYRVGTLLVVTVPQRLFLIVEDYSIVLEPRIMTEHRLLIQLLSSWNLLL